MSESKDNIKILEGKSFEGHHTQKLMENSSFEYNPYLVDINIYPNDQIGIGVFLGDLAYSSETDHKIAALFLKDQNLRNRIVNIDRISFHGHEDYDDKFIFYHDTLTNDLYLSCRGTYVAANSKGFNEMYQALMQHYTNSRPSVSQDTLDFIMRDMPSISDLDLNSYDKLIIVAHSAHCETAFSIGVYLNSIDYGKFELELYNPWTTSIDERKLIKGVKWDNFIEVLNTDHETFTYGQSVSQEKVDNSRALDRMIEEKKKVSDRNKLRNDIEETYKKTTVYRNTNDHHFSLDWESCRNIRPLPEHAQKGFIKPHQYPSFLMPWVDMEIRDNLDYYFELYRKVLLYEKTGINIINDINENDMALIFKKLAFEGDSAFKESFKESIKKSFVELAKKLNVKTNNLDPSLYSVSQVLGLYNVNKNQLFIPIKVNEYYILEKRDFELILQVYDLMKKGNMVTGYTDGSNSLLINTSADGVGFNYMYERDNDSEESSNAGKVVLAIVASFAAIEGAVQICDRLIGKETKPLGQRIIQPLIDKSFGAYRDPKLYSFKDKSFNGTYESSLFEDAELKISIYYYTLEYKPGVFEIGGIDYTENATGLIVVSDGYVHDVRRFKVPLGKDIDNPDEVIQQCIEEESEKAVADLAKLYHSEKDLPFNHYFVSTLKKNAELKISKHYFKVKSINKNFENGDDDYIERVPCFIELSDGVISHTHNFTVKLSKEDKYNVDKIIQVSFEREMEIAMSDYTKVYQYVTRYYKNEINILEKEFNKDVSNLKKKRIINNTFIPIIGENMTKEIRVHVLEKLDKFLDPMIENDDKFIKILEVHDIEISKVKSNELQELEDNFKKSIENIPNAFNEMYESMEFKKESGVWSSLKDGKGEMKCYSDGRSGTEYKIITPHPKGQSIISGKGEMKYYFEGRRYTKYTLTTTYPDGKKRISTKIRYHNDPENNKEAKIHYNDDLENEECINAWKKEEIMEIIRESEEISSEPEFNPFIQIEEDENKEQNQAVISIKEKTGILAKKSYYNTVFQIPNTIVNAVVDRLSESIVSDAKYVIECNEYGYRVELKDNLYYIIGITKENEGMTLKEFKENTYLVKVKYCKQLAEYYNFDIDTSLSDKKFVELVEKKYYDSKSLMEKLIAQMNNNPLLQKILLPLINYFLHNFAGSIFDIATSCCSNRNCMGLYGTYRNADGIVYCVSNCTPNEYNYIISPIIRSLLYCVGNKDRINPGTYINYQNIHILSNIINIGILSYDWKINCSSTLLAKVAIAKSSLVITRYFLTDYQWIKKLDSYFKIMSEIPTGLLVEHRFTNGVYSNLSKEFKALNKFVVDYQLLDKIKVNIHINSKSKRFYSKKHKDKTTNTNALRKISGVVETSSLGVWVVSNAGISVNLISAACGYGLVASFTPLLLAYGASVTIATINDSGSWNNNVFTCKLCRNKFYLDDLGITETQTDIKKFTFCKHCAKKWSNLKNKISKFYLSSVYEIFSNVYQINQDVTGFFESISYQLKNLGIDENPEEYLENMREVSTESNILIKKAISKRYGVNIIIINDKNDIVGHENFDQTLLLVKIYGKYYPSNIAIKNIYDNRLNKMKVEFQTLKKKLDSSYKNVRSYISVF